MADVSELGIAQGPHTMSEMEQSQLVVLRQDLWRSFGLGTEFNQNELNRLEARYAEAKQNNGFVATAELQRSDSEREARRREEILARSQPNPEPLLEPWTPPSPVLAPAPETKRNPPPMAQMEPKPIPPIDWTKRTVLYAGLSNADWYIQECKANDEKKLQDLIRLHDAYPTMNPDCKELNARTCIPECQRHLRARMDFRFNNSLPQFAKADKETREKAITLWRGWIAAERAGVQEQSE